MTYEPAALWHRFRDALVEAFKSCDSAEILSAWATQGERTAWYGRTVLLEVGRRLGLELEAEFLRVDFVLSKRVEGGHKVPLVFIESENIADTAHEEIRKLCSVSAPLKVLLTCVEWGDHLPGGGRRDELLANWRAVARAHQRVWPQDHALGICVAEIRDSTLRLYTLALDACGEVMEPGRRELEREPRPLS